MTHDPKNENLKLLGLQDLCPDHFDEALMETLREFKPKAHQRMLAIRMELQRQDILRYQAERAQQGEEFAVPLEEEEEALRGSAP